MAHSHSIKVKNYGARFEVEGMVFVPLAVNTLGGIAQSGPGGDRQAWPPACQDSRQGRRGNDSASAALR